MRQNMFHGILLDLAFVGQEYPKSFPLFAQKLSGDWGLYGIKVDRHIETYIKDKENGDWPIPK